MLPKLVIFGLAGIALIVNQILADVIKYNDTDFLASGVQLLRWSVEVYRYTDEVPEHICSGSLVKPAVVISAARCFWGKEGQLPASQFVVTETFEGSHRDYPWQQSHWKTLVDTIHVPPSFRDRAGQYADDIAVLQLVTPFLGVTPICVSFDDDLDRRQLAEGNSGRTMGTINEPGHGRRPVHLFTTLEVPFVARERCAIQSEPFLGKQLTPDKICAEYPQGPFDAWEFQICRGDHGSGLAFYSGSTPYLRGVASIPAPDPLDTYWTLSRCSKLWSQYLTLSPRQQQELQGALKGHPEPKGIRFAAFTHIASQRGFLERHIPDLEAVCGQYYSTADHRLIRDTTADADNFECNCQCN